MQIPAKTPRGLEQGMWMPTRLQREPHIFSPIRPGQYCRPVHWSPWSRLGSEPTQEPRCKKPLLCLWAPTTREQRRDLNLFRNFKSLNFEIDFRFPFHILPGLRNNRNAFDFRISNILISRFAFIYFRKLSPTDLRGGSNMATSK